MDTGTRVDEARNEPARKDRIEILAGTSHLPAEFREVAEAANKAGLEGYKLSDVHYGMDLDQAREIATGGRQDLPDVIVELSYARTAAVDPDLEMLKWRIMGRLADLDTRLSVLEDRSKPERERERGRKSHDAG